MIPRESEFGYYVADGDHKSSRLDQPTNLPFVRLEHAQCSALPRKYRRLQLTQNRDAQMTTIARGVIPHEFEFVFMISESSFQLT